MIDRDSAKLSLNNEEGSFTIQLARSTESVASVDYFRRAETPSLGKPPMNDDNDIQIHNHKHIVLYPYPSKLVGTKFL